MAEAARLSPAATWSAPVLRCSLAQAGRPLLGDRKVPANLHGSQDAPQGGEARLNASLPVSQIGLEA